MKINSVPSSPTPASSPAVGSPRQEDRPARNTPVRTDSVAFSPAARALESSGLTAERLSQIQDRIKSGFYEQSHVVDAVANAILSRGDL